MSSQHREPVELRWSDFVALGAFGCLLVVVLLQFLTRYALNDSLGWTEEAARYLLILTCYVGSVTAVRRGSHVFLEFVYRRSAPANVRPMALFVELLGVAYHAGLALLAFRFTLESDQRMVSLSAPKSLIYAVVTLALSASTLYGLARLSKRWRQSSDEILAEFEESAPREEA